MDKVILKKVIDSTTEALNDLCNNQKKLQEDIQGLHKVIIEMQAEIESLKKWIKQ